MQIWRQYLLDAEGFLGLVILELFRLLAYKHLELL